MQLFDRYKKWKEDSRVFFYYLKKYRKYYAIGIFALVIVDGLEAFPPLLIKIAIDGFSENAKHPEALQHLLLKVCLAYLGIASTQGFMRYLWRRYIIRTSMYASHDMRDQLFHHLSTMSPGFFKQKRIGDLVSLASNDIEAVRFGLGPGALTFFDAMFYFIAIPPIMFWISPKLTLLAFIPLLVLPFFVRKMEHKIQKHFREVQDKFSSLASYCQESLSGARIIKGSALEPYKEKEFEHLGQNYVEANLRSAKTQTTLSTGLDSLVSVATNLLFLVGGSLVIGDHISIGVFVAFQRYIQKLAWPMEALGLAANIFQKSIASQKRIDEVMLVKAGVLSQPQTKKMLDHSIPSITVSSLDFKYPGTDRLALKNISLQIKAGMRVGIAGGIGSGKSTLLACLARMEPLPTSTVFFDGQDAMDLTISELRSRIAFVPQEPFLFSKSVRDNILYGSDAFHSTEKEQKDEIALRSAHLASVKNDILSLPEGIETKLGERGVNLSGGQRQRLTIARAIARSPQVLILDDCMSAIDAETELNLVNGLLDASKGITLIIASHRISSFRNLDWLILMDNGSIIAQGVPEEVMRINKFSDLESAEEAEKLGLLQ